MPKKSTVLKQDDKTKYHDLYSYYSDIIKEELERIKNNTDEQHDYDQLIVRIIKNQMRMDYNTQDTQDTIEQSNEVLLTDIIVDTLWQYQMSKQYLMALCNYAHRLLHIITIMNMIVEGYFNKHLQNITTSVAKIRYTGFLQQYFIVVSNEINVKILFEVGLVKVPKLKGDQLIGFKYRHQITFVDFRYDNSFEMLLHSAQLHYKQMKQHPYRKDFHNLICESEILVQDKQKAFLCVEKFLFSTTTNSWADCQFNAGEQEKIVKWMPTKFSSYHLTKENQNLYIYDHNLSQWMQVEHQKNMEIQKFKRLKTQTNRALLQQYADFGSAAKIIDILQNVPEFKLKITVQERQVISAKGNAIVIGRSGTGKTTCIILRLFAISTLMKIRQKLFNQRGVNILDNSLKAQFKEQVGLHTIFTTSNPVLIGEVRRYYYKLYQQIKLAVQNSQNKGQKQMMQSLDDSMVSDISEAEMSLVLNDDDFKESFIQFDGEEELDKLDSYIDNSENLSDLKDKDFPLFITVKKLLYLIDGSLKQPYFKQERFQKANYKNNAGWNDGSGVRIKPQYKYQLEEYNFQEQDVNEQTFHQESSKNILPSSNKGRQIIEVEYEYFLSHFWPRLRRTYNKVPNDNALANLVWTQIYSYIKGSEQSYSYPDNYLPLSVYIDTSVSMLTEQQMTDFYSYFLIYQEWIKENGIYDQMDLVNYIINKIDLGEYDGIPLHYIMIDEIQDLPHAVIQLISRITEQGLYFSGDTAQNIAKGVGFRFQDLKTLFKPQFSRQKNQNDIEQFQLTVNFRSHNNILQLSNSVVSIIEIFFPKTIDKLKQERSDLDGPKPVIIDSDQPNTIQFVLLTHNEATNNVVQLEFGCQKVVIVKDQASKALVPKNLQELLILTVFESKGLEFDDVVLFNFFADSQISESQWELLNYLFIDVVSVDSDVYEAGITHHQEQTKGAYDQCGYTSKQKNIYGLGLNNSAAINKIRCKPIGQIVDLNNYSALCNELKQLYVAITRAKQRLIIFDQNKSKRQYIENIWKQCDLTINFNSNDVQKIDWNRQLLIQHSQTSKNEWKRQGIKNVYVNYSVMVKIYFKQVSLLDISRTLNIILNPY